MKKFPLKIGACTSCKTETVLRIVPAKFKDPTLFNLQHELCCSCLGKLATKLS